MKKTTLLMVLSMILAVALGVGSTMAYLQDTDEDVNVMTLGNVDIEQHEFERVQNEDGTYELPTTVTLLVNPEQAKMLVEYENTGVIHADLVYRGDSKTAQAFLDAQDLYFELLEESEETESDDPTDDVPVDDIIQDANDIIWGKVDDEQKDEGGDA